MAAPSSGTAPETSPVGSLLLDLFLLFAAADQDRLSTRALLEGLNTRFTDRPWMKSRNGKPVTEIWLAQQLRPFGLGPRTLRFGPDLAKGYLRQDFTEVFRRYIPRAAAWPADRSHPGALPLLPNSAFDL